MCADYNNTKCIISEIILYVLQFIIIITELTDRKDVIFYLSDYSPNNEFNRNEIK